MKTGQSVLASRFSAS